jgi:hypothetical protein
MFFRRRNATSVARRCYLFVCEERSERSDGERESGGRVCVSECIDQKIYAWCGMIYYSDILFPAVTERERAEAHQPAADNIKAIYFFYVTYFNSHRPTRLTSITLREAARWHIWCRALKIHIFGQMSKLLPSEALLFLQCDTFLGFYRDSHSLSVKVALMTSHRSKHLSEICI